MRRSIPCPGSGHPHHRRNQKLYDRLAGRYDNIEVVGFTDRVYDYMAQSDLLLSKPGGITLFESIFAELPMLAWEPFWSRRRRMPGALEERGLGRLRPRARGLSVRDPRSDL